MHPVTLTIFGLGAVLAATALVPATASAQQAPYCREFQRDIVVGNRVQHGYGTACLQPDGSWQTVSDNSNNYAPTSQPVYNYNPPVVYTAPQPVYVEPAPVVTYYQPEPVYYAYPQSSFSLSIGSGSYWNGHRYHGRDQYFSNGWNNGWHGNNGWGRRWR